MEEKEEKNEETENNNYKDDNDDFQKVPIEHSIEIVNIINNINKISRDKFKKKFYKNALIIIAIISFLIITKKMLYDGIIKVIFENLDDAADNNDNLFENDIDDFYLFQNKSNIDINSFNSPQLRNPQNLKIIEKLEISLRIENEKFVHLKIKDMENERWEVPEDDIINEDFLIMIEDNELSLFESNNFQIELLKRKDEEKNKKTKKNKNDDNDEIIFDDEFAFRLINEDKKEFLYFNTSENFLFSDTFISFQTKLSSDKIYGFGERTHDFKLGEGIYTMWTYDCGGTKYDDGKGGMNQYSHQPIGLHKTRYKDLWLGFIFLNTNAQDVVLQYNKNDDSEMLLNHKAIGGIIDYYIIVGNSPEEIVRNIQFLLGIPSLPPYWSLGNHQSRYGIKNFTEFKNIYNNYKKYEIPIDTMWIDIDAMDNYADFTLNKNFEKMKSFIKDDIHKDGGKFVPIIDMGISYENENDTYVELGNNLNIFIKSNYTKQNLIGKVWPGKTVFPDFFNPKVDKFWKKGLNDYNKLVNFDGIWLDMNEPANLIRNTLCLGEIVEEFQCTKDKNKYFNNDLPYLPGYSNKNHDNLSFWSISENALIFGNKTAYDVKPLLAFYQNKITYDYLQNDLGIRPFILSRSTTIGTGKYSFHWLGDNYSSYENLKNSISGIFNFNIFGIPFTGADICGFIKDATKDLCLRWYNLGVFYPFMRNHNSKMAKDQFPWSFNDEKNKTKQKYDNIEIIKNNINIRYSLIRYIYSQLFLISLNEKGSFFKPLMFEFPEERISYEDIESRIMFGEAFLICAFYDNNEDEKEFDFPKSNFNKYPSGISIMNYDEGNKKIKLSGKLNKLHIFLRGGFIVPYQNTFNKYILNTIKLREEKLNLIVNIDNFKKSKGVLFFDNDEANTIQNKEYIRVDLNYNEKKLSVNTNMNNMENYYYNDHIIGTIEFLRINEILELNKAKGKDIIIKLIIVYKEYKNKKKEIKKGIYDKEKNKVIFEISKNNEEISIFDIKEMLIN